MTPTERTKVTAVAFLVVGVAALVLFVHNLVDGEPFWATLWLVSAVGWAALGVLQFRGRLARH